MKIRNNPNHVESKPISAKSLQKLKCLNGNDVMSSRISDHHPIVRDGVLFWNVMMQAKVRRGSSDAISFNNAFGIIETEQQYLLRLSKVACVISEIVERYAFIDIIGLCEGPVNPKHVQYFWECLNQFTNLKKFICNRNFVTADVDLQDPRGVMLLTQNHMQIEPVELPTLSTLVNMKNRFQLWKLTSTSNTKFLALGHFPFAGDEVKNDKLLLSENGKSYSQFVEQLMKQYENEQLILCADFNFNPYFIESECDNRFNCIPANNSTLFSSVGRSKNYVTVDGILLSKFEKQKHFSHFKISANFFKSLSVCDDKDENEENIEMNKLILN